MTQRSVGRRISRQHRWLRYLLRRRPCLYISIFEIFILIILSAAMAGAIYGLIKLRHDRIKIEKEDAKLEKIKNYITFAHCEYEEVSGFNEFFCQDRARKQAFAFRHHQLKDDDQQEDTCIDRHEQVDCHDEISDKDTILPEISTLRANVKQCAGLFNVKLGHDPPKMDVLTFTLTNEQLQQHQGEIVHASELVIKCPKCALDAASFKFTEEDTSCYRHITTDVVGWPAFAADCEDLQETGDPNCNVIGQ